MHLGVAYLSYLLPFPTPLGSGSLRNKPYLLSHHCQCVLLLGFLPSVSQSVRNHKTLGTGCRECTLGLPQRLLELSEVCDVTVSQAPPP